METYDLVGRLDPVDRRDIDEPNPPVGLDGQAPPARCPQLVQQRLQLRAHDTALSRVLHRRREAVLVIRLEQEVQRVYLERAQRVTNVGGDENDRRHPARSDLFDYAEAVELGQFNVHEYQIRAKGLDGTDRVSAIGRLRSHR